MLSSISLSNSNYWINIDKPYGITSSKVVSIVKKLTKAKKVGHGGTLDPFASGVLPVAINYATKSCNYILDSDKKYYFEISWGELRNTDDIEGIVVQTSNNRPTNLEITNILSHFIGEIEQVPSKFSAIKINGQKAYDLARKNEDFTLNARKIFIRKISLIFNNQQKAGFEVECSKGTYVRSLCRDISIKLNSCGYVSKLVRLRAGIFDINQTISLAKLKNIDNFVAIDDSIVKLRDVLNFMAEIAINDDLTLKVKNGQSVLIQEENLADGSLVKIINNDELIGIGQVINNQLKPINIFNN